MKNRTLFFIVSLALFFSCSKEKRVELNYVNLGSFKKIEFNSPFDVYLKEDTTFSIKIIGDEDKVGDIEFKLINNVLTFRNKSNSKLLTPTKNKIEIYINSKPLRAVDANETCNIRTLSPITSDSFYLILRNKVNEATLELDCHLFQYWNSTPCGGKVTLYGKTDELSMLNYAIMSVDAKNLISTDASVENSSKGDFELTVINRFEYSIKGTGNIILYGSPKLIIPNKLTSSGRLIRLY